MAKTIVKTDKFIDSNRDFLEYISQWNASLEPVSLDGIIKDAGGAQNVAIISVDLIEGFARTGPLASDRVASIIEPAVDLLKKAYQKSVRKIALTQDSHPEDSPEFNAFPPHCVKGTPEAETIREFKQLPFFDEITVIPKKSISSGIDTDLEKWLDENLPRHIIVIGDCTDLCTYQLAMHLHLLANAKGRKWRVTVPTGAVQTYDLPVSVAKEIGAMAHPGDFFHMVFLYHMALNGINTASIVTA